MANLILSRKLHQAVWVGDNVKITILEILGDRVRMSFSAPLEVVIMREELLPDERLDVLLSNVERRAS